jgi:hypothetical protein
MAITRIKTNQITDLNVTTGKIANNAVTGAKLANNLSYGSDFTVTGNLTVSGTTTSVSTTNTRVEDAIIALSAEATGSASVDSGLLINRGDDDNYALIWDESADQFVAANVGSEDGDTSGNVTISSYANFQAGTIKFSGLNDGTTALSATVAEINLIDGGATVGTTAVASGDGIITNDGGTMRVTNVDTFDTYLSGTTKTLTNKTLTAPKFADAGFIADANGNELIIFQTTGSAVNQIDIHNAAASGHPKIETTGGDTNINLTIDLKGSGALDVSSSKIVNVTDPTANQDAATKAYVDTQVSAGSSLTIGADSGSNDTVTVGTDTLTFAGTANEIETTVTNNQIQIGLPDDVTVGSDLTVTGNLTVNGTTTTLSTTNSVVSDSLIELNNGASSNSNDLGFIFERGSTGDNAAFIWDESADTFQVGTTTATGASTGNLTVTDAALKTAAITASGNVTTTGSFVIGSADMDETDLEKLDGITNGTAAANKALVLDANLDIGTIRNITSNGNINISSGSGTITTNVSNTQLLFSSSGVIAGNAAMTFDGTDVTFTGATNANSLDINSSTASISSAGIITTVEDIRLAADNKQLEIGAGTDFTIGHDGTDTTITNSTGILKIDGTATSSIRVNEAGANVDFVVEGDSNTGLLTVDASQDNVGIGGAPNANAILDINDTGAILLARGTTGERPTGVTGMFRYNTTSNTLEYYDNSGWAGISSDFTLATSQTFNGDNSTVAFTLSSLSGSDSYTVAGVLVMLNGVVQEPTTVYGISGTTLTFTTAPASGDLIEVRKFTTTTTVTALADSDGDTQVQVEESADEDIIRFDIGGSEKMTLNSTQLSVTGNIVATGDITANGDITLGDANTDTITLGAEIGSDIIPDTDGSRDLGSAANRWAEAHIDDVLLGPQGDIRFYDSDASNFVAFQSGATVASDITWTLPTADAAVSGYALVSDASGTLSWAAAGATTTSDTTTNAEEQLYFGDITSGAVTAVHHDADLTYNPSTGSLTSAIFKGALIIPDGGNIGSASDTDAIAISSGGNVTMSQNLTVTGDFTVNGTTTTVATTNMVVSDNLIELNNGASSNANDSGIVIERGSTGDNAFMGWDESADKFIFGTTTATGASTGDLTISSGTVVASTFEGALSGNASTATTLETTRAIEVSGAVTGTANFDGSAAINIVTTATSDPTITLAGDLSGSATLTNLGNATLTATIAANSVALSTDTTGNYVQQGATSGNGISGSVNSEGGTFTVTSNATNANTGSTIVFRDGSGNFSAGTITANLTGNASGSSGSCTGNSATATTATNVNVTANNTANETVYIAFVDGATGAQGIETDTGLSYNPSTNVLSTTASSAQYADLAEMYAADAEIEPGTVVHFAGEGKLAACDTENCRTVAGIVSTDPAHLMNADQEGVALALAGRVPCKVTGAVAAGDLMVSAGNGMAMANNNAVLGTVIGKAIEAHEGGEGVIEVLALMM